VKLSEYEKRPGFAKRDAMAEAEVRLALAMDKPILVSDVCRWLQVPPPVAMQWLGRIAAKAGETKVRISVTGLPQ
jgi:hypothetical protein